MNIFHIYVIFIKIAFVYSSQNMNENTKNSGFIQINKLLQFQLYNVFYFHYKIPHVILYNLTIYIYEFD